MRPLRYSINVTLDGSVDHKAVIADANLHHFHEQNIAAADALILGRVTYQMMQVDRVELGSGTVALRYVPKR